MRYLVFQLCGGENREKGWTGMVYLPEGDMREAPTSELNFLAGETERVFQVTNWDTRISFITDLEMLTMRKDDLDIWSDF